MPRLSPHSVQAARDPLRAQLCTRVNEFFQARFVATASVRIFGGPLFRAHSIGRAEEAQLMRRIAVLNSLSWIA